MSNLVNGFKNYKSASNIFHKFASFLKDNGECTLGGNKLLERFCKVEGSKDRRTLESMFPKESAESDPILEAVIEHFVLSFKLWKEGNLYEFENFIHFCKSANERHETLKVEDGELFIINPSKDHPFPHFQTDLDCLFWDTDYFSRDDFFIDDAYKLQHLIDGKTLADTFNSIQIRSVHDFNDIANDVINEYLKDEVQEQSKQIFLGIAINLSKAEIFNNSLKNLNKIIRDVVQGKFKY